MNDKTLIGIAQGDTNGIGYEVIIKALADARMMDSIVPVIYGSSRFFGYYKKGIPETEQMATNVVNSATDTRPKRINIINCVPDNLAIEPGQPTLDSARAAKISLETAVADLKAGHIDALVCAPVDKHTAMEAGLQFSDFSEYLATSFQQSESLMFMCSNHLKVGLVTNHLPISQVSQAISSEKILSKLRLMNSSLTRDFGFDRPKIAVMGLNPHAGDNGTIGTAEADLIAPAVRKANEEGILAFGPYAADGFFGSAMCRKFDAVLAMYHDQGLIPFKAFEFDDGIHFAAGLPVVCTSTDHGTAFDIAGKCAANPGSMISAILAAADIVRNRREYAEISANPLEIKHFEGPRYERTIVPE